MGKRLAQNEAQTTPLPAIIKQLEITDFGNYVLPTPTTPCENLADSAEAGYLCPFVVQLNEKKKKYLAVFFYFYIILGARNIARIGHGYITHTGRHTSLSRSST